MKKVKQSTIRKNIPEAHSFLSNLHIPSGSDLVRFFSAAFYFSLFFFFSENSRMFPLCHVFCNYSLNILFFKSLSQHICLP